MRHDAERPQTSRLITDAPVPGHWIPVLATMRANTFTRLSLEEVRAEAAHLLIISPTTEVARTCFADLLDAASPATDIPTHDTRAPDEFIEIMSAEEVVPEDVPARTWIFLPHRQDGWTQLETTSARVRADLVKEITGRDRDEKLTLIEYGINLWLWAEPPYGGGDPVCHAGELISWESAWALGGASDTLSGTADTLGGTDVPRDSGSAAIRPPIYFGLPEVLRRRRMGE
ncbi:MULTISPECIES: hypothetical protein [Brevibacterium]|uniref:Uncharacterized protein n=1 Tax=Brevibacterium aurantiacum TaxID=273384 RepID=A0A2H1ILQ1_BREAU|nr:MULTISPECIES: hypothetical protein [Brevibacterium]SMX76040.1 hypothetical protein BAURA86_00681 [Brevibacterium aurantiacum]